MASTMICSSSASLVRCARPRAAAARSVRLAAPQRRQCRVCASVDTREKPAEAPAAASEEQKNEAQRTTEKLGLEAGLFQVLTSKDEPGKLSRTEQAKQLLTQYGSAYLITSISFAIVSFACCYLAVDAGVDVSGLLSRLGLEVSQASESVGTFALAYAAHKALSPVRFPPTVALTPVVAKWIGNGKKQQQ